RNYGIGFALDELAGHKRVRHGGAIYGFATELAALPGDKLGVIVVASKDGANGMTDRIAETALRQMLAVRQGKPLPRIEETKRLDAEAVRRWAGHYRRSDKEGFDLVESAGRLWLWPVQGDFRVEVRALGDDLVGDDCLEFGRRLTPEGDGLRLDKQ